MKPRQEIEHLSPNCTDQEKLFASNILEYYRARPYFLRDIRFHHFASWWRVVNEKPKPNKTFYLLNYPYNTKYLIKRRKFVVIKPVGLRPSCHTYFYGCLLLYKPHYSEAELIVPYLSHEEAFLSQTNFMDQEAIAIQKQAEEIDNAITRITLAKLHEQPSILDIDHQPTNFSHPDF